PSHSCGTSMPSRPSSPICRRACAGKAWSRAHCAAFGASTSCAKPRAISRTIACSSLNNIVALPSGALPCSCAEPEACCNFLHQARWRREARPVPAGQRPQALDERNAADPVDGRCRPTEVDWEAPAEVGAQVDLVGVFDHSVGAATRGFQQLRVEQSFAELGVVRLFTRAGW